MSNPNYEGAIAAILDWLSADIGHQLSFVGIGHRVVHGGAEFSQPVIVDDRVLAGSEALVPLAPLHQPHHIAAIRACAAAAPGIPQVACFDTAFHRTQPVLAQEFALPRRLTAKGIRRYGFHGLSYEYIVSVLPEVAPECASGKIVVAHLGNGASLCAIDGGRSVATTMGFTPADGLMMGTRIGALDPGVIPYLLQHEGMDAAAIEKLIYEQSGLLGVSGLSSDMRTLLASDLPAAKEAVDLFAYRIGPGIGLARRRARRARRHRLYRRDRRARGGYPGPRMSRRAMARHLPRQDGQRCQRAANFPRGIARIGLVVPTDENLIVARHTERLLGGRNAHHTGSPEHESI